MYSNSWDRDPYFFTSPAGVVTTVKELDEIAHNFIIANYNSLGAVDNDGKFGARPRQKQTRALKLSPQTRTLTPNPKPHEPQPNRRFVLLLYAR